MRFSIAIILLQLCVQPLHIGVDLPVEILSTIIVLASATQFMVTTVRIIDEANLALRRLATDFVLAATDALEDSAPFEVQESDEHDSEAAEDGDVE